MTIVPSFVVAVVAVAVAVFVAVAALRFHGLSFFGGIEQWIQDLSRHRGRQCRLQADHTNDGVALVLFWLVLLDCRRDR